eukprot:scaffold13607_cov35-Tisochrysis_lutea.AAC.7
MAWVATEHVVKRMRRATNETRCKTSAERSTYGKDVHAGLVMRGNDRPARPPHLCIESAAKGVSIQAVLTLIEAHAATLVPPVQAAGIAECICTARTRTGNGKGGALTISSSPSKARSFARRKQHARSSTSTGVKACRIDRAIHSRPIHAHDPIAGLNARDSCQRPLLDLDDPGSRQTKRKRALIPALFARHAY